MWVSRVRSRGWVWSVIRWWGSTSNPRSSQARNRPVPSFYEPGLPICFSQALWKEKLRLIADLTAVAEASVRFICFGTPQESWRARADLTFVGRGGGGTRQGLATEEASRGCTHWRASPDALAIFRTEDAEPGTDLPPANGSPIAGQVHLVASERSMVRSARIWRPPGACRQTHDR